MSFALFKKCFFAASLTSSKQLSIIRNSKDWYKRSKVNHPYDIHLCAYSSLLRIIAKFHEDIYSDLDSPSGLNQVCNYTV